jgi:hypothetical protein
VGREIQTSFIDGDLYAHIAHHRPIRARACHLLCHACRSSRAWRRLQHQWRRHRGIGLSLPRHLADLEEICGSGHHFGQPRVGHLCDRLGIVDRRLCRCGQRPGDFSGTVVDFGVLYYFYPGNAPDTNTDFFEPYLSVSHTFGPVTGKISAAYAPKQKGISVDGVHKEDNLYLAGDLSVPIKDTGLAVAGHFGHSFGPSWLTIGDGYSDWNLGVTYTTGPLTIGLQYVDTDDSLYVGSKNVSKAGVVGSIGVSF